MTPYSVISDLKMEAVYSEMLVGLQVHTALPQEPTSARKINYSIHRTATESYSVADWSTPNNTQFPSFPF
jgi:hypothetical protein